MEKIVAKLEYIIDGDTISVSTSGRSYISRCKWIDAPETKKPYQTSSETIVLNHWNWGDRAKQVLSEIIQPGITLILYNYGLDQYGRQLSDWYVKSSSTRNNIQYQLALRGLGCPFLPYNQYEFSPRELSLYLGIAKAAPMAYKAGLGFWKDYKDGKFLLPYDF